MTTRRSSEVQMRLWRFPVDSCLTCSITPSRKATLASRSRTEVWSMSRMRPTIPDGLLTLAGAGESVFPLLHDHALILPVDQYTAYETTG